MFEEEQHLQEAALEEEENLLLAAALMVTARKRGRRRRVPRRRPVWVKPWLLRRPEYGHYENLLQELHREDPSSYKNFLRVPPELFMELIERVGPRLQNRTLSGEKPWILEYVLL